MSLSFGTDRFLFKSYLCISVAAQPYILSVFEVLHFCMYVYIEMGIMLTYTSMNKRYICLFTIKLFFLDLDLEFRAAWVSRLALQNLLFIAVEGYASTSIMDSFWMIDWPLQDIHIYEPSFFSSKKVTLVLFSIVYVSLQIWAQFVVNPIF